MADKMILVVAVGQAGPAQLNLSAAQLGALRPLLKHLKAGLDARAQGAYSPVIDSVTAPPGPELQQAMQTYLNQTTPDVIVSVASAAGRAAQAVVDARPSRMPIVFTVVSDPVGEGLCRRDPDGKIRGTGITGVSRSLADTVKDCIKRFKQCVPGSLRVHVIHRQGVRQADQAHRKMTGGPAIAGVTHQRHQITGTDCQSILQILQDPAQVPPNVPPSAQRTGLFLIPDDLVGSCAPQIIAAAHDPSRKIPTFVQQLEYVEPDPADPQKPCALAGYGLTAHTMGDEAADYLDKVLRDPDQASSLPVKFPKSFEFWINRTVADQLGIAIPPNVLSKADKIFPPLTAAAALALPMRAAARPEATAKPKRKKPSAAKRTGAQEPRSRKAPARTAKRTAGRGKRSSGRRPKRK